MSAVRTINSATKIDVKDVDPKAIGPIALPPTLSPISTIRPTHSIEAIKPTLKPALPAPSGLASALRLQRQMEKLNDKTADILESDLESLTAQKTQIDADKKKAMDLELEAAKSRTSWSSLANISQYIWSAGSIVVGSSVNGLSGYALIASGIIGLGDRIIHDMNFLNTTLSWVTTSVELQKKIKEKIELASFYLQMGLSLAGGVGAYRSGALAAANINQFYTATSYASTAVGLTSRLGESYYDKKMADLSADIKNYEAKSSNVAIEKAQTNQAMIKMVQASTREEKELVHTIAAARVGG